MVLSKVGFRVDTILRVQARGNSGELSRETGQHFVMGILLDSLFVANSKKKTSANFLLYFTPQQQQMHQATAVQLHRSKKASVAPAAMP